ncbi:small multi-drug export protein [candidate division KSB1 bacterium]|nr:small multi-drug export protein [candidate division KSB1 bacterium]
MEENLAQFFGGMPVEMITVLIAMIPIAELRGAIPWALANPPVGGGLSWPAAYFYAVLGNFLPIIPVLLFIEPVSKWLRRYPLFDKFFDWLFTRTRKKAQANIDKYEALGLAVFVAIPLPVTGAWTGAFAAFVFGIKFHRAVLSILAGILVAGVIVTLASLGVISFLKIFI